MAANTSPSRTLGKVVIRSLPGEPNLTISLTVAGRQRNLNRPKSETLDKPLARIQKSAVGTPERKKSRQNGAPQSAEAAVEVALHEGPSTSSPVVDGQVSNEQAWQHGRLLVVGNRAYTLHRNPPIVDKIEVYGKALVGIPILPLVTLTFADLEACQWQWHRRRPAGVQGSAAAGWEEVGRERCHTPQPADVGHLLRITCLPAAASSNGAEAVVGEAAECTVGPVASGPELGPAALRHPLTRSATAPPAVRVVTYNILADQYASSTKGRTRLFAYCPWDYLQPEYRRPLVLGELLGFRADLICLQEVDEKAFTTYFLPHLQHAGYEGAYTNKAGRVQEGCATFWRAARYCLAARADIPLKECFRPGTALSQRHARFAPLLAASPALAQALQRVGTIAQLCLLQLRDPDAHDLDHPVCLVNTHLFYHPMAGHIRTMHVGAMLAEAAALIGQQAPGLASPPALLFCGDLNSDVNDGIPGAVELLATGRIGASFWDWRSGAAFRYHRKNDDEAEEEAAEEPESGSEAGVAADLSSAPPISGIDMDIPFRLRSADGLQTEFTNFVRGYSGALDYVWYEPHRMAVRRQIPLPSRAQVQGYLPSQRFPSDHLSVVFDLEFLPTHISHTLDAADCHASSRSASTSEELRPPCSAPRPAHVTQAAAAAAALSRSHVIAVPTDTLYGIAASATSEEAIERIYAIKRRQDTAPLAICVGDVEDVALYGEAGHLSPGLLPSLLPGPVTVLLLRRPDAPLSPALNPSISLIGVRVPNNGFVRDVCRRHGAALALTSANLSGSTSPVAVAEFQELWPHCAAVYDGGNLTAGREGSTIIDLSRQQQFKVLRKGNPQTHERLTKLLRGTFQLELIQ